MEPPKRQHAPDRQQAPARSPAGDPYGYPPPYARGAPTNSLAVASLVCGVAAFAVYITWPLALIFGYIGRRQIDESHGREEGRSLAVAGIVLGWIFAAMTIVGILMAVTALLFFVVPAWQAGGGF